MMENERWQIIYNIFLEKPAKVEGTITSINGLLIEIDGKYIVNANNIIRGTKLDSDLLD